MLDFLIRRPDPAPVQDVATDPSESDTALPSVIFYFSPRDLRNDFRHPLVEAWRRRGVPTYYIRMKRRPSVSEPFSSDTLTELSITALPGFLRKAARRASGRGGRPVYFDATCITFPMTLTALSMVLPSGLWCFDLHDDYVYTAEGWKKRWRSLQQQFRSRASHVTLHAAESLRELVPNSVALGNASEVLPLARPAADPSRLLVIGSIDERYDYEMLARIADLAPDLGIDLWGHISQNREVPRTRLAALLKGRPNIHHFGRFEPEQVREILARYTVAFAPYLTGVRLTRYIDPMRYYDCLNSGMELVATDIPMTRPFEDAVHVAETAEDVVAIWRRLLRDPAARRNQPDRYRPITWDQRARDFLDFYAET